MQRITPFFKATTKMLTVQSTASFCINMATLDPSKHNYMHHNPNNMYVDHIDVGVYEYIADLSSVAPRTYERNVLEIVTKVLNDRYVKIF